MAKFLPFAPFEFCPEDLKIITLNRDQQFCFKGRLAYFHDIIHSEGKPDLTVERQNNIFAEGFVEDLILESAGT
jgi:hypothetical protein